MNEFQLCRSFHTVSQYEKFEMKFLGCEILGTAAITLTPLTNFPRAPPPHGRWVSLLKVPISFVPVSLTNNRQCNGLICAISEVSNLETNAWQRRSIVSSNSLVEYKSR